jgi:hypothetical protein
MYPPGMAKPAQGHAEPVVPLCFFFARIAQPLRRLAAIAVREDCGGLFSEFPRINRRIFGAGRGRVSRQQGRIVRDGGIAGAWA